LDDTVTVGESWQYDVSSVFSDPDGDALVYSFSGLPSWVAVNGSTLSGVPDSGDVAQVSITVTAADPFGEFVEDSFTLTVKASNLPIRVASYGPNGTHWPGQVSNIETPYMYDTAVPNRIEVTCSWPAIQTAIKGLTSAQVNEGVLILVQPGDLGGGNSASDSTDALLDVGDKGWTKRVTVAPRDGWGTLYDSNGAKVTRINKICLSGIDFQGGLRMVSCNMHAIARCRVSGYMNCYDRKNQQTDYQDWEFVEVVKSNVITNVGDADVFQLQVAQNGAQADTLRTVVDGCYFAPNYMSGGSSAHQDTIQFLGTNAHFFDDTTIQDTVVFSSNRCAVNGGLTNSVFRNCWLNSRKSNQIGRYPIPSGYEMLDSAGVSQGTKGNITFDGGYIMGSLSSNQGIDVTPYDTVINGATIDYTPSGHVAPTSGSWIVDATLDGVTNPGLPIEPTDLYLDSIWGQ
ncbi:putative Ig domain-containing protein, partial [Puniceicoccaceae bacterium K14]|nr:putative Ig domain-containing protein [Puniceicoccaceae bacterium K14]